MLYCTDLLGWRPETSLALKVITKDIYSLVNYVPRQFCSSQGHKEMYAYGSRLSKREFCCTIKMI